MAYSGIPTYFVLLNQGGGKFLTNDNQGVRPIEDWKNRSHMYLDELLLNILLFARKKHEEENNKKIDLTGME